MNLRLTCLVFYTSNFMISHTVGFNSSASFCPREDENEPYVSVSFVPQLLTEFPEQKHTGHLRCVHTSQHYIGRFICGMPDAEDLLNRTTLYPISASLTVGIYRVDLKLTPSSLNLFRSPR